MPVSCVVPPTVLLEIARRGTPDQRTWALWTLATDTSLRTFRAVAAVRPAGLVAAPLTGPSDTPKRTVYDGAGQEQLPGKLVRDEGTATTGDEAVDEAYDGLGATFDFYLHSYERHSIDDQGLPLLATVHYGDHYDNAFWNGSQMVFGDGDGELFQRFTRSLDVIGHELTHGVTEDEARLTYLGQSGALNESISDVFGTLVKQYHLGQTAEAADWLIGAELLAPGVHGVALRSMKAPGTAYDDPVLGKDDQPATMAGYVHTTADNGGVHTNSGIPNHAFYLAATALGGKAWEVAGRVWYDALRDSRLKPTAQFHTFATTTVRVAKQAFDNDVASAVRDAWQQVGVIR
ncbi:MAG: peptidase M4 family protein [Pseudonocardiales bacterium]|nr:MAG: peptidase M4 family protein [Pseudonocardiales bacterium]